MRKHKISKKTNNKRLLNLLLPLLCVFLLFIAVGFSALSTTLSVNGNAAFAPVGMIRVMSISTDSLVDATEQSKSITSDSIKNMLDLNSSNATAKYNVVIKNLGQTDKELDNIVEDMFSNEQIEYEKNFRDSLFKVTHEIKNPIAVCKGYLDMLDVNNNKQVNKYIPIIKEEIDRTLLLMKDFLNLTRLKVDKSIMDISLLLDDLINSTNTLLTELNIKFKYQILDDEMYIKGDYNRLKQVFINLIKNSIEAIPKNREGIIKLCINLKKDNILISIEDNGIGISKNKINKIGEPFFTTKEKGTGLGVRLSTEIIEQHNGSIKYVSKEGKGTKVIITLPICE